VSNSESLQKCFDQLSFSLPCCHEGWHGNLRVIFEEACKEKLLQITLAIDGAFCEFHEPFKGESLQSVDEQTRQDGIICHYVPCLGLELVNVLVR